MCIQVLLTRFILASLVSCLQFLQVSDLIRKIQTAYVETLEELSWMDDTSKEKAREKVGGKAKVTSTSCIFSTVELITPWSHVGLGNQRTHRLPRSHPAGREP